MYKGDKRPHSPKAYKLDVAGLEPISVTTIRGNELRNKGEAPPPYFPPCKDSIQEILTLFSALSLYEKDALLKQLTAITERELKSALEGLKER